MTVLRKIVGGAVAVAALVPFAFLIMVIADAVSPRRQTADLPTTIFACVILIHTIAFAVWAAWVMLRAQNPEAIRRRKAWRTTEGKAFKRQWYALPVLTLMLPVATAITVLGVFAWVSGLAMIFAGDFKLGSGGIGFAICAILPGFVLVQQFIQQLRGWGTPLAIVGSNGIAFPRQRPDYLRWDDITSINVSSSSRGINLVLELVDPKRFFPEEPRPWGPWFRRKAVILPIDGPGRPLADAAQQAYDAWHARAANADLQASG